MGEGPGRCATSGDMKSRLRVAVVTQFPRDVSRPAGGVEAVSVQLVHALAGHAHLEIEVVTLDRQRETPLEVSEWQGARIHRLRRHPTAGELRNALGPGRRQIGAYLRTLRPDLVHAHDTYGLMVQGLALPRVFTVHGFIHGDTRVSGRKLPRLRAALWRYFETRGWADQHAIVSISPYVREYVKRYARGPIYDICNPIDPAFYDIERRPRKGVVFSAAAICPRKNTLRLVEAVAQLLQGGYCVELRLAGPITDDAYGARLQRFIGEQGLERHVRLLGPISTAQVQEELAQAQLFALVSLEENAPMGIAEAMAAGVPVVTSNRCGMPYMVRHGETGYLVDPEDPADIAQRLASVLADECLARDFGMRARALARESFHPQTVAARTHALYYEIYARYMCQQRTAANTRASGRQGSAVSELPRDYCTVRPTGGEGRTTVPPYS